MKSVVLKAPAKINLYLEIVGPRTDGYTDVVLVLQSVALADTVTIRPHPAITIYCDHPLVPLDQHNLAHRAVQLLQETTNTSQGAEITIAKTIPVAAGLAGGSGNGAAVLVGLNELWQLGLTPAELARLAARLGSDVPFCIRGGTALGYGRGEVLAVLASPGTLPVVLVKPRDLQVSTAWAYQTYRSLSSSQPPGKLSALLCRLTGQQPLADLLYNDLEQAVLPHHPRIAQLKQQLQDQGALGVLMSGSGPTVFALAQDEAQAQNLAQTVAQEDCAVFVTHTISHGITLV
ncbi:4-(cytidine 5'-diphospho)-2-C-methyl-D-erythritol kinase [Anthocerotibacter panamensis]|uniref:4-(cytidine 5'-diphospho)-2-C-methyl-D-erythritol kinase n=1 Tax=Anthocerotibacter panamensis TaxID=2857077 RepID=UPI001C4023D7|nr:4-(cytidine 5'-diphospho)-2-C-methyl-D-erythritol kinase [Anthocerotibacter panamensis]